MSLSLHSPWRWGTSYSTGVTMVRVQARLSIYRRSRHDGVPGGEPHCLRWLSAHVTNRHEAGRVPQLPSPLSEGSDCTGASRGRTASQTHSYTCWLGGGISPFLYYGLGVGLRKVSSKSPSKGKIQGWGFWSQVLPRAWWRKAKAEINRTPGCLKLIKTCVTHRSNHWMTWSHKSRIWAERSLFFL